MWGEIIIDPIVGISGQCFRRFFLFQVGKTEGKDFGIGAQIQ